MIRFGTTYKTAQRALLRHSGRTALTMLGVVIGVFSVVSLVSMGIGVQNYIQDQFESLGANMVFIAPGRINFADDPAKSFTSNKLDDKHIELIEMYASDVVDIVTPSIRLGKTASFKTSTYYATIIGSRREARELFNLVIDEGRFYSENEEKNEANVVVIGPLVREELFPTINPIGQKIRIEDNVYEVIGTSLKKGQDFDDNIYMPYKRAMEDFNLDNFSGIAARAISSDDMDLTMKRIELALLRDLKKDDFSVISAEDVLSSIQNVLGIMTAAVGAIAGISLLVGGIGIMNIMLVSVTERIKEIGLRKAVGATPRAIAVQFIIEAIMISVGGGGIGLLLGWLASLAARSFVRTEVPLWAVGLAFGFSVLVGLVFGTYPAIKASKKDPIEALRFE